MKIVIITTVFLFSLIYVILCCICEYCNIDINDFYNDSRNLMFIKISAIILPCILTFSFGFIPLMKDKLLRNEEYKKRYNAKNMIMNSTESINEPLIGVIELGWFCFIVAVLVLISHVILNFTKNIYAVFFSLSLSITFLIIIIFIGYNIWRNVQVWFSVLRKE